MTFASFPVVTTTMLINVVESQPEMVRTIMRVLHTGRRSLVFSADRQWKPVGWILPLGGDLNY